MQALLVAIGRCCRLHGTMQRPPSQSGVITELTMSAAVIAMTRTGQETTLQFRIFKVVLHRWYRTWKGKRLQGAAAVT